MRKVVFLLDEKAPAEAFASCKAACLNLQNDGIGAAVTGDVPAGIAEAVQTGAPEPADDREDTLYLADVPEVVRRLSEDGYAAIALLHAGNAGTVFPGAKYIFSEPEEVETDSYVKAYQRCKNLPWDILETKRLTLRETTVEDVDTLYKIYAMPGMTRFMEGLFPDPADEKRYMRDYIKNVYGLTGFGVWSVIEKKTGDLIGRAGFSVRRGFEQIELGFFIGTSWQGRGYAQEACRAVLDYGERLLDIDTVQALVKEGNAVSEHILQKLGFHLEKTIDVEEDIYGGNYPPADDAGRHRVAVSPARYGRYHLYMRTGV